MTSPLNVTIECDLLRGLMTADRFLEEAYGGRFIPIFTQQEAVWRRDALLTQKDHLHIVFDTN